MARVGDWSADDLREFLAEAEALLLDYQHRYDFLINAILTHSQAMAQVQPRPGGAISQANRILYSELKRARHNKRPPKPRPGPGPTAGGGPKG
jgi:hypothetical protein